jgi:hypothetical protein
MGEKYDDGCYDYGLPQYGMSPTLARLRDPSGPGFPPDNYATMRGWGSSGQGALLEYLNRPALSIEQVSSDVRSRLEAAGADQGALLSAGEAAVERLDAAYSQVRMETSQGQMTLQMLSREPNVPARELAATARSGSRAVKQAVAQHVGPLEELVGQALGAAQDSALSAVGARVEAGVNRIGQLAYTSTSALYREIFHRGLADASDDEAAAG